MSVSQHQPHESSMFFLDESDESIWHIKFLIHPPGSNMFHVPTMCISYIPTMCGAGARLHVPIWRGSGARSPGWPGWEGPGWESWGIPGHHGLRFDSHWSHQGHHGWSMSSMWFFWGSPKMEGFWKTSDGSVQWSFHGSLMGLLGAFHIHGGGYQGISQKWMVYHGKSIYKWMI